MSRRPLGHGELRDMRNFKAVAMDYAYYLTLENEGRLYCLTDRQVYMLLVQCEYIGWLTRWYNVDDINQTEVQFIQSAVMEALMSCVDVSIIVEQGKQNVVRNVQQQQVESQRLRDAYEDEYDGSPTSINPNAPTTDFGSTGDRYDALCAALTAFVYQFANAQVQAIVAGDIAAFALLAGAAILLIPGLNLFYLAGAAIALIAGGGLIGVTTGTAVAALTDTDALGNVICFMRDTLKTQSVTQANWAACLDSYPWGTGSHEAIIADFIKPTLASNYLPVLDMLGQAYTGTINGDPLPECPCAPEPERIPVIASLWDPPHTAGSITGPDAEGIWTATSGTRSGDEAITMMDALGRSFVLEDVEYSAPPECQVFLLDGVMVNFTCDGFNHYVGQTITEWTCTWDTGPHRTMRFRMVAP